MKNDIKKRRRRNKFIFWPPRISAALFVLLTYLLIMDDFFKTLNYHPVLYNFFIGTIILALTIVAWGRNNKRYGIYFILIALLYLFAFWHKLLFSTVIATSVWLFLTGILFFLSPMKSTKKIKVEKEEASNLTSGGI